MDKVVVPSESFDAPRDELNNLTGLPLAVIHILWNDRPTSSDCSLRAVDDLTLSVKARDARYDVMILILGLVTT